MKETISIVLIEIHAEILTLTYKHEIRTHVPNKVHF
jgi:hypothetical protein